MGNHPSIPSRISFSSFRNRRRQVTYPFPILDENNTNHPNSSSSSSSEQQQQQSNKSDAISLGYYLKPSGLYPTCTWDTKRVAKLIVKGQLVPRYPGKDDASQQAREECPICMLVYPVLNTTKCCNARLCTECYLQIRPPRHNRQPCPFCKRKKVQASFKGVRSMSEMDREENDHKKAVEAMKKQAQQQQHQYLSASTTINTMSQQENINDNITITASTTAATGPSHSFSTDSRPSLSLSLENASTCITDCVVAVPIEISQQVSQNQNEMHGDSEEEIDQPITLEGCRINILGAQHGPRDCIKDEYEASDEVLSTMTITSNWLRRDDETNEYNENERDDTNDLSKEDVSFESMKSNDTKASCSSSSVMNCEHTSGLLTINVEPDHDGEKKKKEEMKSTIYRGRRSLTGRKYVNDNRPSCGIVLSEEASFQEAIRRSLREK